MELDLVLLCVAMALYIGFKVGEAWYLYTFREILSDLQVSDSKLKALLEEKTQSEDNDLPVLEVRVEKHPEGLFAYRKADGFFIAMGKDKDTLMENLVHNLNNVRVVVAKEDGGDLISP
jgi:hypothetical protein